MKLLLLFLCLFGAVFTEINESREQWITNAIENLTTDLNILTSTLETSSASFCYIRTLIDNLKQKVVNLRTVLETFLGNATKSIELDNLVFDKLHREYDILGGEMRRFHQKVDREKLNLFALSIAAYQNIFNDSQLPASSQLIFDVKSVISREQRISQLASGFNKTIGRTKLDTLYQEVADHYRKFNETFESSKSFLIEQSLRLSASTKKAKLLITSLKLENNARATKKAEMLQNGLNLLVGTNNELFCLPSSDHSFHVDQFVRLAEHFIRSQTNLKSLIYFIDELRSVNN